MFSLIGSLFFRFFFIFMVVLFCFFVLFVVLPVTSLQGRVHDSDPMGGGGDDSDWSVGPGYFSSTRRH